MVRQNNKRSRTGRTHSGAYVYANGEYARNHVVWPGREDALDAFVHQRYGGLRHKYQHAHSSNSEDALTWSCFDCLAQVPQDLREQALAELWELAYGPDNPVPEGVRAGKIILGRTYGDAEKTEVDVSIEGPGTLVFIEAKLYSAMSQADPLAHKPYNQIQRKLRVGVREALASKRELYFILLDLAPPEKLLEMNPGASLEAARLTKPTTFRNKWLTAYWFARYKASRRGSVTPLRKEVLAGVDSCAATKLAANMGWLTWADVFKTVLRAVMLNGRRGEVAP